jgi:hypothetical protein
MRVPADRQATPVLGPRPTFAGSARQGRRRAALALFSLICVWFGGSLCAAEVPLKDQPHLRRPIAAAWLVESKLLAVANQRSGTFRSSISRSARS